ncbi:MAG: hypothetical protein IT318_24650 [Anaerolineales bacterium]|nr:hypothetical protein [Anaerolineales bacterium]
MPPSVPPWATWCAVARRVPTLTHGMYLVDTLYNFCLPHRNLRIRRRGRPDWANHRWDTRTRAMAAGLTDHWWSEHEVLTFQVPPPRWAPPKRRGRPSKATQALVARYCT